MIERILNDLIVTVYAVGFGHLLCWFVFKRLYLRWFWPFLLLVGIVIDGTLHRFG